MNWQKRNWPKPRKNIMSKNKKKTSVKYLADTTNICFWCDCELTKKNVTFDHIVPLSSGVKNLHGNKVLSCYKCNQERGCVTSFVSNTKMGCQMTQTFLNRVDNMVTKWEKIEQEKLGYTVTKNIYESSKVTPVDSCAWCGSNLEITRLPPHKAPTCRSCRKETGRIIKISKQLENLCPIPLDVLVETLKLAEFWVNKQKSILGITDLSEAFSIIQKATPKSFISNCFTVGII